jgi:hypothetical protein
MKSSNPKEILVRDSKGICFGECRDLVLEGMIERQEKIKNDPFEAPEYFPDVPWARKRNDQPGWLGGHV